MKRLIKAARHLFVAFHTLLIFTILLASALFYIAFRPDGLSLVNTFVLEPLGMEINRSQGSLSEGFSLHGLHSQTIDIKTLSLDYNLTAILKG
ncbi:MAG TPA: hypothetical protein VFX68_07410, partial [Sulfuricurvum sp.]|nr:hypothetical protein [Sulfuricurvum sp.]